MFILLSTLKAMETPETHFLQVYAFLANKADSDLHQRRLVFVQHSSKRGLTRRLFVNTVIFLFQQQIHTYLSCLAKQV